MVSHLISISYDKDGPAVLSDDGRTSANLCSDLPLPIVDRNAQKLKR
jgi:hypothetical protein